jgi:hypothetical protein
MTRLILALACLLLPVGSACANDAPADNILARGMIVGKVSDKTRLLGEWQVTKDGKGSFAVKSDAMSCSGTYDGNAPVLLLKVPFTCTDGSSGEAVVMRTDDLGGGVGTATLSDGRTVQFSFGSAQGI